ILEVEAKLGRFLMFWGRTDGQWRLVLARTEADGADDFDARRSAADTYPARVSYGGVGDTAGPVPPFFVGEGPNGEIVVTVRVPIYCVISYGTPQPAPWPVFCRIKSPAKFCPGRALLPMKRNRMCLGIN